MPAQSHSVLQCAFFVDNTNNIVIITTRRIFVILDTIVMQRRVVLRLFLFVLVLGVGKFGGNNDSPDVEKLR